MKRVRTHATDSFREMTMTDEPDIDIDAQKVALEKRRAELIAISEVSSDSRAPVELDQQSIGRLSRMDALQGQAMAQETERRRKAELHRIEQALQRIESGDYGYCTICDEPVAKKRLELDPAIQTCVDCAGG